MSDEIDDRPSSPENGEPGVVDSDIVVDGGIVGDGVRAQSPDFMPMSPAAKALIEKMNEHYADLNLDRHLLDESPAPVDFGGYGTIYTARLRVNGSAKTVSVAIKKICVASASDDDEQIKKITTLHQEIALCRRMTHRNVLKFYGLRWRFQIDPPEMVSKWERNGHVIHYLKNQPEKNTDVVKLHLLIGALKGLVYLHSQEVIHGDLHGQNVLVSANGHALLCDFGLSWTQRQYSVRFTDDRRLYSGRRLSQPPEAHRQNAQYSWKIDIWSYGCLILEVQLCDDEEKFQKVGGILRKSSERAKYNPDKINVREDMWKVVTDCCAIEDGHRPTATAVLKDLYSMQGDDEDKDEDEGDSDEDDNGNDEGLRDRLYPHLLKPTSTPSIANAPLVGLAKGNGQFSNVQLAVVILGVPWLLKRALPLVNRGGFWTYLFLLVLCGVPSAVSYWWVLSRIGRRVNDKVKLPGRPITDYIDFNDAELREKYASKPGVKIPIQVAHDAYFEGKIDLKGDVLEVLEQRHDWASFEFTMELFVYVFTVLVPDVLFHTRSQDENQVREHYDRGDDFYESFLGPRMVYTSGVIHDTTRMETLEELQDNKLELVCNKLSLSSEDRYLDIGCGWGALVAHAAKNYGCDATGITIAKNQTKYCSDRIAKNGLSSDKARVLCVDYSDFQPEKTFTKISCLELPEHVGIRRYGTFLRRLYDLLDDGGLIVLQVDGLLPAWQYEDLAWGLFMHKYVCAGANPACSLGSVVTQLESAGFELKNVDVLGVHYSATLYRWYLNWLSNKASIIPKYGDHWFRIWSFFLAWATIASIQGSASVFQITMHKKLSAFHRVEGVNTHFGIHATKHARFEFLFSP